MNNGGLESNVCAHFGSCEYFTVVDVEDQAITGIEAINNMSPDSEHNCAASSRILRSHNVDTVLVSGIGGRPLISLVENKIKVFSGAMGKVSDALQDYNNGMLQELSTNGTCTCSHH